MSIQQHGTIWYDQHYYAHTAIGTLNLYAGNVSVEIILLCISSMEENVSHYYVVVPNDELTLPTSKAVFDQLTMDLDREDRVVIIIKPKAIKRVSFTASLPRRQHHSATFALS